MITVSDSVNTVDLGRYYAILPVSGKYDVNRYCKETSAQPVSPNFCYDSGSNSDFLSVEQLKKLIADHVDHPDVDSL